MRHLVLFLLMTSTVLAVDVNRVGTHTIGQNLTDTVNYVDYFYGDYANSTADILNAYDNELDYIKTRSGPLVISRWSVRYSTDSLMINVTGVYPGFVVKEDGIYRIDGKGFIDNLCTEYPYSYISKIDQEFDFDIVVPESLRIVSVPENGSEDMSAIFYNLTVTRDGNTVHRSLRFIVKNNTDVFTYCDERNSIDSLLKAGITAELPIELDQRNLGWIVFILILLILSLYYLVRG